MTYEEAYMKAKTLKELEEMVQHDITVAKMFGLTDRFEVIAKTCEKVANLKFKETKGSE